MRADFDFSTYVQPKGCHSAIDTIVVSDSLRELVSSLESLQILDKGHKLIYSYMMFGKTAKTHLGNLLFRKPVLKLTLVVAGNRPLTNTRATTIDHDWNLWCYTFRNLHSPQGSLIGDKPTSRIRDIFSQKQVPCTVEPYMMATGLRMMVF